MSECGSVITLDRTGGTTGAHCGTPVGGRLVRIGQDDQVEVWNSGFRGYLGAPQPAPPGWWPTGDRGRLDEAGRLQVLGRLDNVIVTPMGRNVSPEWVEGRLTDDTPLLQAVVLAPDLRALIHAPPAVSHLEIERTVETVNCTLPPYAQVRCWRRLPVPLQQLPGAVTANGRPRRRWLADQYAASDFQMLHQPTQETA